MDKVIKKAAEILVDSGYGSIVETQTNKYIAPHSVNKNLKVGDSFSGFDIDPFADTLEGRRQADIIEDWLFWQHIDIWIDAQARVTRPKIAHQWRLKIIKWCLTNLIITEISTNV